MSPATRNPKPTKLAARLLGSVARFLLAYPLLVISSFLVATVASVLVTVGWLQLQTDQNALVSNDEVYHQRYMEFLDEFGDQEFLHVVIEVDGKAERAVELADEIAAEVAKIEEHVRATYHRIPADAFGSSILLLPRYSHDTLEELVEGLEANQTLLRGFIGAGRFSHLLEILGQVFRGGTEDSDSPVAEWGGEEVRVQRGRARDFY